MNPALTHLETPFCAFAFRMYATGFPTLGSSFGYSCFDHLSRVNSETRAIVRADGRMHTFLVVALASLKSRTIQLSRCLPRPLHFPPHNSIDPFHLAASNTMTDLEGWRLVVGNDSHGQHQWVYLSPEDPRREGWKQSAEDRYWLGLGTVRLRKSG